MNSTNSGEGIERIIEIGLMHPIYHKTLGVYKIEIKPGFPEGFLPYRNRGKHYSNMIGEGRDISLIYFPDLKTTFKGVMIIKIELEQRGFPVNLTYSEELNPEEIEYFDGLLEEKLVV